jgi:rubrerythrin
MGTTTEKNLGVAFTAESKASVRNAAFAMKAEQENLPQIARLFRAISNAEEVHAKRYLLLMRGKIGSTEDNLKMAFENEIRANIEEYPRIIKVAEEENASKAVMKAFTQSRDVESQHAELYKRAINDMLADRETEYYVCSICGNISENKIPDNCPVCGAAKSRFMAVS